ncbi:CinA family protein [Kitasatospora sp. MAP5-34]|uniref:CinA family protein n=1 Tax=Kitasatospora sp. MAP5-34 TaxID=3035102 RepID=UPI00247719C4|nr:CinA family protein [Kitasatospora sp. MAP5-34]MDH6576514.1 nicotinamide-nucleotide amidase [Kitasatospora sp. MAP5-34]
MNDHGGTHGGRAGAYELAERAHAALRGRGATLAVAESLTGGLLAATLVDVPGASASFRGSVTAYATEVKASVLGVDEGLLAVRGPVHPVVARQMAEGVRRLLGATYGLSTTGVAGPEPQDGQPVGTVHLAVAGPTGSLVASPLLSGCRATIRETAVVAALELLLARISDEVADNLSFSH